MKVILFIIEYIPNIKYIDLSETKNKFKIKKLNELEKFKNTESENIRYWNIPMLKVEPRISFVFKSKQKTMITEKLVPLLNDINNLCSKINESSNNSDLINSTKSDVNINDHLNIDRSVKKLDTNLTNLNYSENITTLKNPNKYTEKDLILNSYKSQQIHNSEQTQYIDKINTTNSLKVNKSVITDANTYNKQSKSYSSPSDIDLNLSEYSTPKSDNPLRTFVENFTNQLISESNSAESSYIMPESPVGQSNEIMNCNLQNKSDFSYPEKMESKIVTNKSYNIQTNSLDNKTYWCNSTLDTNQYSVNDMKIKPAKDVKYNLALQKTNRKYQKINRERLKRRFKPY